jgi:hypothetical protein
MPFGFPKMYQCLPIALETIQLCVDCKERWRQDDVAVESSYEKGIAVVQTF